MTWLRRILWRTRAERLADKRGREEARAQAAKRKAEVEATMQADSDRRRLNTIKLCCSQWLLGGINGCWAVKDPRCAGGNCSKHCREYCQGACMSAQPKRLEAIK